ncbi:MAG: LysM peptidoglycan-binding domain-containing protein [Patescibacteria group bacterium]
MVIPVHALIAVVVIFGFLTGSSLYFYNKSHPASSARQAENSQQFSADLPDSADPNQPTIVDELTEPAQPKGRVTYPAHVYTLGQGETLFAVGVKFAIDWQLIVLANGLENENVVQAGKQLVIPKISTETDFYRVNFLLDDQAASEANRQVRDGDKAELLDPLKVAKAQAVPFFGVADTAEFTLLEQNVSEGTALVQAKSGELVNVIGLFQPKVKGDKGFWAILYIEHHDS